MADLQDVQVGEPMRNPAQDAPASASVPYAAPAVAAAPAAQGKQKRPSGCNLEAIKALVMSPDGALRLAEWLLALISFASMASADGYDNFQQFQWLVACGVLTWFYAAVMIVATLFDVASSMTWFPLVELILDALFVFLNFTSAVAASYKLNNIDDNGGGSELSDVRAGVAFSWLLFFTLIGSTFFSFLKWRK
jgi:hypothetical protein